MKRTTVLRRLILERGNCLVKNKFVATDANGITGGQLIALFYGYFLPVNRYAVGTTQVVEPVDIALTFQEGMMPRSQRIIF